MAKLYILHGQVSSGKTSTLEIWCKTKDRIDGILTPGVNGKKHICHIASGECRLLEADETSQNTVRIGSFIFNNSVFEWGKNALKKASKMPLDWLIIDEVGPLEIRGAGLEPEVSKILKNKKSQVNNILIVVRESLLPEVIKHYSLDTEKLQLISVDDLAGNKL